MSIDMLKLQPYSHKACSAKTGPINSTPVMKKHVN